MLDVGHVAKEEHSFSLSELLFQSGDRCLANCGVQVEESDSLNTIRRILEQDLESFKLEVDGITT